MQIERLVPRLKDVGASHMIPLSVPSLGGNEWTYIKECLDTNWVSYVGPFVERFEKELAVKVGASHAVAMSSGTAALHVALLLAGVRPNDEVVMPDLTFVAPANAVRYCFAWPALIDVRATDWQMDIQQLADFLVKGCTVRDGRLVNKATGRRIAAVLPVHLLGGMCDIDEIADLATRYGLPLIEDAAECLGASYKGRAIGAHCCAYGGPLRLVATSFNGNKIITTGGGGALFSNDTALAARAKHISTTAKADKIDFYHDEIGFNYRLTNIAAALGVAQLEQLHRYVEIKRSIAQRYVEQFAGRPEILVHPEPYHCRGTFWMYTARLDRRARPVIDRLNQQGIMARPVWVPIHLLPVFRSEAFVVGSACADQLYQDALSLPCSVGLDEQSQATVAKALLSSLDFTGAHISSNSEPPANRSVSPL